MTLKSNNIVSAARDYNSTLKTIFGNQVEEYFIGTSVTSIGRYAFYGCSGLTSIIIPNSVTSIGYEAFSGCSGLTSIIVESGNTVYDSRNNCNAIIETATNTLIAGCKNTTIPNSVTGIGWYAFDGCSNLTSITIHESVTSIGFCAFLGCTSLVSITIPESVTSIGEHAFDGCSSLTSVTIPDGLAKIGGWVFQNCSSLTSVTIPNSVTSIGWAAFSGCESLTSITISERVRSIDREAFSNCSSLTNVYCYAKNVPSTGYSAFDSSPISSATLHVPAGSVSAYKAASPWSGFGSIVAIE